MLGIVPKMVISATNSLMTEVLTTISTELAMGFLLLISLEYIRIDCLVSYLCRDLRYQPLLGFFLPTGHHPQDLPLKRESNSLLTPFSGNHLLDTSSLLRNQYQASPGGNMVSSGDIEFMDPAILAVGKGRLPVGLSNSGLDSRTSFSSQYSTYENEARLQLLI